jgi:hypothetical protein
VTRESLIARLLVATPWPPETYDPTTLMTAANAMCAARVPLFAEIEDAHGGKLGPCEELSARQAAWDRKMTEIRDALATQRTHLARARRAYR